jgi:hypothetical protein
MPNWLRPGYYCAGSGHSFSRTAAGSAKTVAETKVTAFSKVVRVHTLRFTDGTTDPSMTEPRNTQPQMD